MSSIWSRVPDLNFSGLSRNDRIVIFSTDISADASNIQIKLTGHSATAAVITGVSIGERNSTSPDDFNGAPTLVTFSGASSVALGAGASVVSDQISFSIDKTKDYLVHVAQVTTGLTYVRYKGGILEYYKQTTDDDTLTQSISGYTSQAFWNTLYEIYDCDMGTIENSAIAIVSNSPNVEDNVFEPYDSAVPITVSSPDIELISAGGMFLIL